MIGVDTNGTQQYHQTNVSDQTAKVASEIYRGAADISQAAMMAGAQLIKTATNQTESITNPETTTTTTYTTHETAFETEIPKATSKRGRKKKL